MESENEENPDDQDYILSILRNLKSPNRFATGNPINNYVSVITENTFSGEDSDTNDSNSNFSLNGELSEKQLVENFNRIRTGHKLDDYILSILDNGKCMKKPNIQSTVDSTNSIHCSDVTLKPFENAISPGSVEVSDILFKEGASNHKLDEVLHVAMQIVKPNKGRTTKSSNVSSWKEKSVKSNHTETQKQTEPSTLNLTCQVCNFVFNSEKSRNRHVSNEHIKRVSNKNHVGNWKRNSNKSENSSLETGNCCSTTLCFSEFPEEEENVKKDLLKEVSVVDLTGQATYKTVLDPDEIGDTKDVGGGDGSSETSSRRQFHNPNEDQCSRTRPFLEHEKMTHKQCKSDESNSRATDISELPNTDRLQFNKLVCDGDVKISLPRLKLDLKPSSLLSKLCSSIQIVDKSEPSFSSVSLLSSSKLLSNQRSSSSASSASSSSASSASTLSYKKRLPSSSSNATSPAVLIPEAVLRERHWIILDTPNNFCAPSSSSTIKGKEHQNQTQNNDIVGIKSILDESMKTPSVTRCLTSFPESTSQESGTLETNTSTFSNIIMKNQCSPNTININQINELPFVGHYHSPSESVAMDASATQESDHFENDEFELIKHSCARHLAFSDFIARYYAFKKHRDGNSSPKEDNVSTLKDTGHKAVHCPPFSRDFILSPPKKRWKCYLGNE